jgi:hypothetical protein
LGALARNWRYTDCLRAEPQFRIASNYRYPVPVSEVNSIPSDATVRHVTPRRQVQLAPLHADLTLVV